MLYRLVRPMRRDGSRNSHFQRRILIDIGPLASGLTLAAPIGFETASVTITPKTTKLAVSLRRSNPAEVKVRNACIDEYLEHVWAHLRSNRPITLTHRQATALAGELYRAWATSEGPGRTRGRVRIPLGEVREGESAKEW